MSETDNSIPQSAIPEIRNNVPKAPGILPKNAQTWVIVIIAAIMILVIALSNSGAPRPKSKPVTAPAQNANPPNQKQIDQYRAMVDEEALKLAQERQRVDQAKLEAQSAAANAQNLGQNSPYPQPQYPATGSPVKEPSPEEIQRQALEAERKKREYASYFSSNVALSYRKDQTSPGSAEAAGREPLQAPGVELNTLRQTLQNSAPAASQQAPAKVGGLSESPEPDTTAAPKLKARPEDPALQAAAGKTYRLFEGTVIETVLTNRLDGSFSGPVNSMVTTNVYSHDHQNVLIPQGSRVLGEVQRVSNFGQQRLAVTFHRIVMPDGYSLNLDQFHGLSQVGETGLRDQVNHHYLQVFGISLAIGVIAGIEQAGANYGYNTTGTDQYRQGVSQSLSQSSLRILDRYLNVLPTFVIREGHRIKVYLTDDLMLPAYDRHRLPGNL